tara:strand:+ start:1104 stop:2630 length:1527 start_codon:yes stop_codon:yes gene_type:complete
MRRAACCCNFDDDEPPSDPENCFEIGEVLSELVVRVPEISLEIPEILTLTRYPEWRPGDPPNPVVDLRLTLETDLVRVKTADKIIEDGWYSPQWWKYDCNSHNHHCHLCTYNCAIQAFHRSWDELCHLSDTGDNDEQSPDMNSIGIGFCPAPYSSEYLNGHAIGKWYTHHTRRSSVIRNRNFPFGVVDLITNGIENDNRGVQCWIEEFYTQRFHENWVSEKWGSSPHELNVRNAQITCFYNQEKNTTAYQVEMRLRRLNTFDLMWYDCWPKDYNNACPCDPFDDDCKDPPECSDAPWSVAPECTNDVFSEQGNSIAWTVCSDKSQFDCHCFNHRLTPGTHEGCYGWPHDCLKDCTHECFGEGWGTCGCSPTGSQPNLWKQTGVRHDEDCHQCWPWYNRCSEDKWDIHFPEFTNPERCQSTMCNIPEADIPACHPLSIEMTWPATSATNDSQLPELPGMLTPQEYFEQINEIGTHDSVKLVFDVGGQGFPDTAPPKETTYFVQAPLEFD